jgi:hypothetical protein
MRLNLVNQYTYTLESIIQAVHSGLRIESVALATSSKLRESRLFKSIHSYVSRSTIVILGEESLLRLRRLEASQGLGRSDTPAVRLNPPG